MHCTLIPPPVDQPAEPEQQYWWKYVCLQSKQPWLFCQERVAVIRRFPPARWSANSSFPPSVNTPHGSVWIPWYFKIPSFCKSLPTELSLSFHCMSSTPSWSKATICQAIASPGFSAGSNTLGNKNKTTRTSSTLISMQLAARIPPAAHAVSEKRLFFSQG